jgi:hypothetical protein
MVVKTEIVNVVDIIDNVIYIHDRREYWLRLAQTYYMLACGAVGEQKRGYAVQGRRAALKALEARERGTSVMFDRRGKKDYFLRF